MSDSARILKAGPFHAAALALIHARAFPPAEVWSEAAIRVQLGQPGVFGLLCEAGGMFLGRVVLDEAEVLTLAVQPEARRLGFGKALLRAGMREASLAGADSMFLEVSSENQPARLLYARCGFAEIGRRRRYYPGGADALAMKAALDGAM